MSDFFEDLKEARQSRNVGKVCFPVIYEGKRHNARGYLAGEMLLETEAGYLWTKHATWTGCMLDSADKSDYLPNEDLTNRPRIFIPEYKKSKLGLSQGSSIFETIVNCIKPRRVQETVEQAV